MTATNMNAPATLLAFRGANSSIGSECKMKHG